MPKPYYLLLSREPGDTVFFQQFGDFDRETVEFERDDFRDHGYLAKDLRIVTAKSAKPADCDAAINLLNRIASSPRKARS